MKSVFKVLLISTVTFLVSTAGIPAIACGPGFSGTDIYIFHSSRELRRFCPGQDRNYSDELESFGVVGCLSRT